MIAKSEREQIRFEVIELKSKVGYFTGLLEKTLEQLRDFKRAEQVKDEAAEIQMFLHRILRFIETDRRGINNAKPDIVKASIKQMLDLLPEQERAAFIQQLQQEQLQICQTNRDC
jgi:hypothetical protein